MSLARRILKGKVKLVKPCSNVFCPVLTLSLLWDTMLSGECLGKIPHTSSYFTDQNESERWTLTSTDWNKWFPQFTVSSVHIPMVNFICTNSQSKSAVLAAAIDVLEQNALKVPELRLCNLWRHSLYTRRRRSRFRLVCIYLIFFPSYCTALLAFYVAI